MLLRRTWVVVERAILSEENQRVEKLRLNLVRQVCRLDLKIAKDCKHLGHGQLFAHLEDIEETGDVLLDVQLHLQRLEGHILDAPQVRDLAVGAHLELGDVGHEHVDVVHVVVKDLLGRVLYSSKQRLC